MTLLCQARLGRWARSEKADGGGVGLHLGNNLQMLIDCESCIYLNVIV